MTTETESTEPVVRVLKTANCPSLSGRATLTYQVGCIGDADVQFRVCANSGSGMFSNDWVAASAIEAALSGQENVSAPSLHSTLYEGKSKNSAGFLMAVLKHEGLIDPDAEKRNSYVRANSERFVKEVQGLIASGINLDPDDLSVSAPELAKAGKRGKRKATE